MKNQNTTNKNKIIEEIKYCAKVLLKISNRKSYIELFYKHINHEIDTIEYIDKMNNLIDQINLNDDEFYNANNILKKLFLIERYTLHNVQELINSAIYYNLIDINITTQNTISKNNNNKYKKISSNSNKTPYYTNRNYREILVAIRN
ncbi:Uncharacterised protein [uncultured Clostridium sp.]|nr:Uncharacterised protein [uncultured Clostridium sp.]